MRVKRLFYSILPLCVLVSLLCSGVARTNEDAPSVQSSPSLQAAIDAQQTEIDKTADIIAGLTREFVEIHSSLDGEFVKALPTLTARYSSLKEGEAKYRELCAMEEDQARSLKADHPKLKAIQNDKQACLFQLKDQVTAVERSLRIQLDIQQKILDSLKQQLGRLRGKQSI